MSTETATNPLLTEGRGVVIRDTKGIGEPVLGRILKLADGYAWVGLDGGRVVRFEVSTLCAMLPGDHERWMLTAPQTQSSEEYDGLRTRQARLEATIDRLHTELDIVTAVLDTADDAAVKPFPVPSSTEGAE